MNNLFILKSYNLEPNVISHYHRAPLYENENGNSVTINAERYADMLVTFGLPGINKHDPDKETLFQQDGVTSHMANMYELAPQTHFP